MKKNYFGNCLTAEDVKKAYFNYAKKFHPDNGGDAEIMKEINVQYKDAFSRLKNTHYKKDGSTWKADESSKYATNETPDEFIEMIEKLMKFNVKVEIIGCFLWVSGDTKSAKEELKSMNFRWHSSKQMWYHKPENYIKFGKKEYSMDEIRLKYENRGVFYGKEENKKPAELLS